MEIIPWSDRASFEQTIVLDDKIFFLTANYNIRDEAWYLTLDNADGVNIVSGKKLTLNTDIIAYADDELKPNGYIFVVPIADTITEITRDNIGVDVKIVFIGIDELL